MQPSTDQSACVASRDAYRLKYLKLNIVLKKPPCVTIVINNFNYARYLPAAIESALQQSYQHVQVIVVDDGSTDDSRAIIEQYGDRITPVLKENGGQASALNAGFARSHGDIIIFLDADDALLPDVVERVVSVFAANPSVVKVQYYMEIIDSDAAPTGLFVPPIHAPLPQGDLRRHVLTAPFDLLWMPTSGNAFSAQALKQTFPVPEQHFPINADLYVIFTTIFFGEVATLEEVGAYYRVHETNQYALATPTIDLPRLRQTINYLILTQQYIEKMAVDLQLSDRAAASSNMCSVYLVAARLVSLKLDPGSHPIAADTISGLFRLSITAVSRRFDLSAPMKAIYMFWFLLMAPGPAPLARWLARQFLFPHHRNQLNKVLGRLHRRAQLHSWSYHGTNSD